MIVLTLVATVVSLQMGYVRDVVAR
jgi:hypothetical protein